MTPIAHGDSSPVQSDNPFKGLLRTPRSRPFYNSDNSIAIRFICWQS